MRYRTSYIYTVYSAENDMTFIMQEDFVMKEKGNVKEIEVIGFYFGEPNEESTKEYFGKLKAEVEL